MTYIVVSENEIVKAEMAVPDCWGWSGPNPVECKKCIKFQAHCLSLPRIPIEGKHKWEVWQEVVWGEDFRIAFDYSSGVGVPTVAIPIQPTSYTKAMQELKNSPLGEAWDNIICVCRGLIRDNSCDCNCKEFHDETLPNERHPNK